MTFQKGQSGNLKGRPPKKKKLTVSQAARGGNTFIGPHFRRDGYVNVASGLGTSADRRMAARWDPVHLNETETRNRYRGGDMEARIIETKPNEALRRGYEIKIPEESGGKELAEQIMSYAEDLELDSKLLAGCHYENAYGGGAIVPATDDLGELSEPLDEGGIVTIDAFHVLEPRELQPDSYYTDLRSPKFRQPETWRLMPLVTNGYSTSQDVVIVHESRLITLPGIRVSSQTLAGQRPGWGDSVLMRCDEVLRDFGQSWGTAAHLLTDFARGVLKLSGLAKMMESEEGEKLLASRIEAMDAFSSSIRSLIISDGDDFQRTASSVSGLDTMLIQFAQRLAAAADMPVTVLMGMSPAGMNATGEGDRISWYDRIAAYQKRLTPYVERMIRFIMLSNDGPTGGEEPDVWSIEWRPLYAPSAKEDADTKLAIAQADQIWYNIGAVSSDDIANSHWGGDSFSASLMVDFAAREAQKKAEDQAASDQQAHELAMAKLSNPTPEPADAGKETDPNADPHLAAAAVEAPDSLSVKGSKFGGRGDGEAAAGHQETAYSCGPASLGYALTAIGVDVDEAQLRSLTGATSDGVNEVQLGSALDALGVSYTEDRNASFANLLSDLKAGNTCLICVDDWEHWVAIVGVLGNRVLVRDPANTAENIDANTIHSLGEQDLLDRWKGPDDSYYILVIQARASGQ